MTQETSIIDMTVSELDAIKSGLPAHTYIAGLARRKAIEVNKSLSMLEIAFNVEGRIHHCKVYLKASPNA